MSVSNSCAVVHVFCNVKSTKMAASCKPPIRVNMTYFERQPNTFKKTVPTYVHSFTLNNNTFHTFQAMVEQAKDQSTNHKMVNPFALEPS